MVITSWKPDIPNSSYPFTQLFEIFRAFRQGSGEPINVFIIQAEEAGEQNGVMDFPVGSPRLSGLFDGCSIYIFTIHLGQCGDVQKRFQFIADRGILVIFLDFPAAFLLPHQDFGGSGMCRSAKNTLITGGNQGGDQFPLPCRQG